MAILLILGLLFVGLSAVLAARAFAFGHVRRRDTLAQIGAYGFRGESAARRSAPGPRELADRLARGIGEAILRRSREGREVEVRALLRGAGFYRARAEMFLGYRALLAVGLPAAWLVLVAVSGSAGVRSVLGICAVAGFGWVAPTFFLQRRGAQRLAAIDRELPEFVDLLVTTVEAGVGFAASLRLVAARVEGPLGQEIRLVIQEQSMGLTVEDALEHMIGRAESPSLRAFVQAIVQGQKLGVSIGKILRDLAVDMRSRRRHAAEERAQKTPTKILFPLVGLILPALFIVSLGGPIIGLIQSLGSAV